MSDPAPDREPAPSADMTIVLRPGERLGPVRLVRELGLGGQGVVYEAVRESDGLVVAAKILRTDVHLSDDLVERFEREAQAAQRLHHENIVAVHGLVEWQGFRIILQELVTGGSLDDAIKARHGQRDRTGTDDCRWAAGMCRDLALALQHAHESHVVHRDIKPGNVLLTPGGVPKITDFGLAKVEDLFGLTQTGDRMGTPNYMSPEQVEAARGGVDSRTDIYSLAAVLYRMLSRRVPFQADNLTTLFRDILTRAPMPPRKLQPAVPRDLQAVCLKALHKSPADRYQTAREFADDLQRFLDGKPTLARPEGAIVQASRALSHLAISTLAVVALLVPVGWLLIDVLLKLAADRDVGVHTVRVVAVALAALVLAWPLSLLGLRLSRGRRWTVAAAWALALGLGVLGGWRISEQKQDQIHVDARESLALAVDLEGLGDRLDVDDLLAYVERWSDRLGVPDYRLLGRAFLKRLRPVQAEDWALRLETASANSPDSHALMFAVADALGDDARAQRAAGQLWQEPTPTQGCSDWNRAGDVLADVQLYADARKAYLRASNRPDANNFRDALNLKMAVVSEGLCDYEHALEFLDDYIKWKPEDPLANTVAIKIAVKTGDMTGAEQQLAVLQEGERSTWPTFVHNRCDALIEQIRADQRSGLQQHADTKTRELIEFIEEVARNPFTGFDLLSWCASKLIDELQSYEASAKLYQQMAQLKPESATPQIGLSSVCYFRGLAAAMEAKFDEALVLFRESAAAAQRAVELDPLFYQSYYNLGLAQQYELVLEKGGEENLTVDDLRVILDSFQRTLKSNGLQPKALNNAAYIMALMIKQDPASGSIADAESLVRRAIRLLERASAGDCPLTPDEVNSLAESYDSLRVIEELKGNPIGALEAARAAEKTLPSDNPRSAEFRSTVERLEAQLAGR